MVFLHLRALGIRKDLKKHVDFPAKPHFDGVNAEKMPRFAISDNPEQFQKLFEMLNHEDETVQKAVWELVCMLATNKKMYDDVLEFVEAQEGDNIQWDKIMTHENTFIKQYKHEIIFDIMERRDTEYNRKLLNVTGFDLSFKKPEESNIPRLKSVQTVVEQAPKQAWSEKFLTQDGFSNVLAKVLSKNVEDLIDANKSAEIKEEDIMDMAFWLTLIENNFELASSDEQRKLNGS